MKQQNILWVRIPFSSFEDEKVRPAIIVSNNLYNTNNHDVIVCAITSKLEEMQYSILIDDSNLSEGKMPLRSRIRADKIMQIDKKLILRPFANLNNKTFDLLVKEINELLQRK